MLIGLDFDNTIVSYDELFHTVACEQGVISTDTPVNKLAVRDFLRAVDKEDVWTEMQGYVYGARMDEARAYPNVRSVLQNLCSAGHTLAIISHKTKYPYQGHAYDLHAAASNWIRSQLNADFQLISEHHIFFEGSREEKVARIGDLGCDVFIDDLPEIFLEPNFPSVTQQYLFDPEKHHTNVTLPGVKLVSSWSDFASNLL